MNLPLSTAALLALCLAWGPTLAQERVVLDDSLSPQEIQTVELGWERPVIGRAIAALLAGSGDPGAPMTGRAPGVEIRLDTRDYENEYVRIFLSLPATVAGLANPNDLELRWEATAPFLAGATQPGESALVFEGSIDQPVTIAVFNFAVLLAGSAETDNIELEPFYELEVGL